MELPNPIMLKDPKPVARNESLKRRRFRASTSTRRRLWKENSQLSALLWNLAHKKIAEAEVLQNQPQRIKERVSLLRSAHANLKECIALLNGVLEENENYYIALLRSAFYLRDINPKDAVPRFKKLLNHPESKNIRADLELALARLYLTLGSPESALQILKHGGSSKSGEEERLYLSAAAKYRTGKIEAALTFLEKAAQLDRFSNDLKEKTKKVMPLLWALAEDPASAATAWSSFSWFQPHFKKAAQETRTLLEELGRKNRAEIFAAKTRIERGPPPGPTKKSPGECFSNLEKSGRFCWLRYGMGAERFFASLKSLKLKLHASTGSGADGHCGLSLVTPPPRPPPHTVSVSLAQTAECLCEKINSCVKYLNLPEGCSAPAIPEIEITIDGLIQVE